AAAERHRRRKLWPSVAHRPMPGRRLVRRWSGWKQRCETDESGGSTRSPTIAPVVAEGGVDGPAADGAHRVRPFETIEEMQAVLDTYLEGYNQRRPHHGRGMNGRTPAQAFTDGIRKSRKHRRKRPCRNGPPRPQTGAALSGDYPHCTAR